MQFRAPDGQVPFLGLGLALIGTPGLDPQISPKPRPSNSLPFLGVQMATKCNFGPRDDQGHFWAIFGALLDHGPRDHCELSP